MKITAILILIIVVVLTCGCTAQAPATPPPTAPAASSLSQVNATVPDFTGRWSGKFSGASLTEGYYEAPGVTYNFSLQRGRIVTGAKEYTRADGKTYYENFYGAISRNGDLIMGDSLNGYTYVTMIGPDTLEVRNIEAGPDAKAMYMVLTRLK